MTRFTERREPISDETQDDVRDKRYRVGRIVNDARRQLLQIHYYVRIVAGINEITIKFALVAFFLVQQR